MKWDSISRNTLINYMLLLTKDVENKVKELLSKSFAIVFDGWSSGTTHYICIFATFPASNSNGYEKKLL